MFSGLLLATAALLAVVAWALYAPAERGLRRAFAAAAVVAGLAGLAAAWVA